ncbi:glycosyltransferase family 61 protein [Campylobacter hyointestinalis]|uniref:glycosyltransferase family 61 protein n=1 Tax=Campylobacter hyointestinalis TaxID=198 RepID=UPI000CE3E773|nr:glycosyltransferase family 61 protein [Campylobacter hyointestinalis]PPB53529.1 hypothetical protein CDQ68_02425 [Campylobacter hyointestinalis subsp. hyointestinalis]PPB66242.1 hypothetical protein CDQ75_05445 [Campylobacter hyointestinalis subsp. hyointestinalis]PPB70966.1 hypothetical protein CDQ77_02445 [Campylobacter hyointestinalis subsp. hyointestinalis]
MNKVKIFCQESMRQKIINSHNINWQNDGEPQVVVVKNGIIHPITCPKNGIAEHKNYGGVTDEGLNFILLSNPKRFGGESLRSVEDWLIGADITQNFENIKYMDIEVVYLGPIKRHLAHNYIEVFSRLWYFLDKTNLKYKIAFMSQKDDVINWNLISFFFTKLGIDIDDLIEITEPTKFKSVIIPEQSCQLNGKAYKEYKVLFETYCKDIYTSNYEKVYFSKTYDIVSKFRDRCANWDLLDDIMQKNGFKVMYPELMSIEEMISALYNCKIFVAQSGSNAHNAIFCKDNCEIWVLNRSEHIHPYQTLIAQLRNFSTQYVDMFIPFLPVHWDIGPFGMIFSKYFLEFAKYNKIRYNSKKLDKQNKSSIYRTLECWKFLYSSYANSHLRYLKISSDNLMDILNNLIKENRDKKSIKIRVKDFIKIFIPKSIWQNLRNIKSRFINLYYKNIR